MPLTPPQGPQFQDVTASFLWPFFPLPPAKTSWHGVERQLVLLFIEHLEFSYRARTTARTWHYGEGPFQTKMYC